MRLRELLESASGRIAERTTANGLLANRSTTFKRVQQRLKDRAGTEGEGGEGALL